MLAVGALAGCGSGSSSHAQNSRELALQRAQFEQVSGQLSALETPVRREVTASRAAWPQIANGLPQNVESRLGTAVSAASARAKAIPEPSFLASSSKLTGPSAGIAAIYENYEQLAQRGWNLTEAAIQAVSKKSTGLPASAAGDTSTKTSLAQAAFALMNSSLYIDSIYDGHFDLSLLGKSIVSGYEKLGGPQAFGAKLSQGEINALANAYSIAAVRLEPHPAGTAKDGGA